MIENMEPFLSPPDEVRAIIQEYINGYTKEDFKQIPWGEITSIRMNIANVLLSRFDKYVHVYLPDEINPIALAEYLQTVKKYETEKELIIAVVCRAMVRHINDFYRALRGKNHFCFARNCAFRIDLSKKQLASIEEEYRRKCESRKGYKIIRACRKKML